MGILSLAKLGTSSVLPYALGGAFLLGALPAGYAGWKLRDIGYQRHLKADLKASLAATTQARQTETSGAAITDKVRQSLDTAKATQAATTSRIIERVPYYVHDQARPSVGGCGNLGVGSRDGGSVAGASVERADGSAAVPAGWSLSDGFVRLHNYAATGTNPPLSEPPGYDPDAPSGVGMPALAGVLTRNYGVCYGYRAEVMTWRRWYDEQAALWAAQTQAKKP